MTDQRSIFQNRSRDLAADQERLRYVSAVSLVATGLVLRFLLTPVFGTTQIYTVFYPVVLLSAYALGPRPAMLAAGLSAALAYWCFAPPAFEWKLTWANVVGVALFVATSAIAIYLISGLVRALEALALRQAAAEARARDEAERLQDLSSQVTDHLRQVSGLLAIQAEGQRDPALAAALERASAHSLRIANLHHDFAGRVGVVIDPEAAPVSPAPASAEPAVILPPAAAAVAR